MDISELNFEPREVHAAVVRTDRLTVASTFFDGTSAQLLIDTAQRAAVAISLELAGRLDLPTSAPGFMRSGAPGHVGQEYRYVQVPSFAALGKTVDASSALATESRRWAHPDGPVRWADGAIGNSFFGEGVLALDYNGGRVAFSERSGVRQQLPEPALRLRLLSPTEVGVLATKDVTDEVTGDPEMVVLLDTGSSEVALAHDRLQRKMQAYGLLRRLFRAAFVRRRRVKYALGFPGGRTQFLNATPVSSLSPLAKHVGLEHIDGWLGGEFLRDWITVIDYGGMSVSLYEAVEPRQVRVRTG